MTTKTRFLLDRVASPLGVILLVAEADAGADGSGPALRALDYEEHTPRLHRLLDRHYGPGRWELVPARDPSGAREALADYLAGDFTAPGRVPVRTSGTLFQRRVWRALREIPAGTTTTYGQLAARLGSPGASRAVGLANGANPVGIFVPCHRVLGADAALTGFGGGLARKRWLLTHEGILLPLPPTPERSPAAGPAGPA